MAFNRSLRSLRNLQRELAWHNVDVITKPDTNGSLLFEATADFTQPRCTIWHEPTNFMKYPESVGPSSGYPFYAVTTKCPFVKGTIPRLGDGEVATVREKEPCDSCEWFKVVPRA